MSYTVAHRILSPNVVLFTQIGLKPIIGTSQNNYYLWCKQAQCSGIGNSNNVYKCKNCPEVKLNNMLLMM